MRSMKSAAKPPHPLTRVISLTKTGPLPILLRVVDQSWRKMCGAPLWQLSEVTPQLYLGGQHSARGYRNMRRRGISAIINMREQRFSDADAGIDGERHLHLATIDNTPPTIADLSRGAAFVSDEISRGGKVYIHCGVGVGRAPTMVAAYLISTGLAPEDAIQQIKQTRPFVHLTAAQRAVLDEFAATWRERHGHAPCSG
ncbi:MAG: dual specificity protein phosphatase [Chloroflexi bacterium]|nr:dual specificity protein phosphatase [Chloroflexota bacterium]